MPWLLSIYLTSSTLTHSPGTLDPQARVSSPSLTQECELLGSDSSDMKVVEALGGAVDEDNLELCRPNQGENDTLKRGDIGYWEVFDQDVSSMYNSQPAATTHGARLLYVDISRGSGLIKCHEILLILPSLS